MNAGSSDGTFSPTIRLWSSHNCRRLQYCTTPPLGGAGGAAARAGLVCGAGLPQMESSLTGGTEARACPGAGGGKDTDREECAGGQEKEWYGAACGVAATEGTGGERGGDGGGNTQRGAVGERRGERIAEGERGGEINPVRCGECGLGGGEGSLPSCRSDSCCTPLCLFCCLSCCATATTATALIAAAFGANRRATQRCEEHRRTIGDTLALVHTRLIDTDDNWLSCRFILHPPCPALTDNKV
eukprot:Hpha_TRINITY_DN3026_c0_g1::TRINITY_DN3026_c0_g1_i1::g.138566::m.138566